MGYFDQSRTANTKNIKTWPRILSFCSLLCFLLSTTCFFVCKYYVNLTNKSINECLMSFWAFGNSFRHLGHFAIYLLFFDRLRQTFKCSQYRLSTRMHVIFSILVALYLITEEWYSRDYRIFILLLVRSIGFVLNMSILYLFCSKIYTVSIVHETDSKQNVFCQC